MKRFLGFVLKVISGLSFLIVLFQLSTVFRAVLEFVKALDGQLEPSESGAAYARFTLWTLSILFLSFLWRLGGRLMTKNQND